MFNSKFVCLSTVTCFVYSMFCSSHSEKERRNKVGVCNSWWYQTLSNWVLGCTIVFSYSFLLWLRALLHFLPPSLAKFSCFQPIRAGNTEHAAQVKTYVRMSINTPIRQRNEPPDRMMNSHMKHNGPISGIKNREVITNSSTRIYPGKRKVSKLNTPNKLTGITCSNTPRAKKNIKLFDNDVDEGEESWMEEDNQNNNKENT